MLGSINAVNSDSGKNVVVKLTGTPTATEDTTYTVTLTIPAAGITPATGYNAPTADLEKSFTFTVKPASTTTPVTVEGNGDSVTLTAGAEIPEDTTISVIVTGASALTTNGIKVFAFQGDYSVEINSSAAFANATGTLVITLSGTAPTPKDGELGNYSNGLKVVIPQNAFTAMEGYTVPTDDITVSDFKFILNPASSAGA